VEHISQAYLAHEQLVHDRAKFGRLDRARQRCDGSPRNAARRSLRCHRRSDGCIQRDGSRLIGLAGAQPGFTPGGNASFAQARFLGDGDRGACIIEDRCGYELEILKGATRLLPAIEAILLEISTIEINVGAPLLNEVVTFMKNLEFVAYDILQIHRRPLDGALNQIDFIFIREQAALIADKRHFS
jgi:hypothetical protein